MKRIFLMITGCLDAAANGDNVLLGFVQDAILATTQEYLAGYGKVTDAREHSNLLPKDGEYDYVLVFSMDGMFAGMVHSLEKNRTPYMVVYPEGQASRVALKDAGYKDEPFGFPYKGGLQPQLKEVVLSIRDRMKFIDSPTAV